MGPSSENGNAGDVTWTMPAQYAQYVINVLIRQPYADVADLIQHLRQQSLAAAQLEQQRQRASAQPARQDGGTFDASPNRATA